MIFRSLGASYSLCVAGLGPGFPIESLRFVVLVVHNEWIVHTEACIVKQMLLRLLQVLSVHLPWTPFVHDPEQFDFVVCGEDELLSDSLRDF